MSAATTVSLNKTDRWSAENLAAFRANKKINVLPPGPERKELTTEFFDRALKVSNQYPVSAEFDGAGFQTPGLAFEDYSRMGTIHHGQSGERRLPMPPWALNPTQLRSLLVFYVERRAGLLKRQRGSERERLERAGHKLANRSGRIEATLQKMCGEYVALNKSGENPARLKKVKEEIGNYDTQLRVNRNIAAIVLQVVHLYFSVGLDSVGVATEVGLKPPHVRMILLRLHEAWARMNAWRGPHLRINVLGDYVPTKVGRKRVSHSKVNVQKAAQMRTEGMLYREIALALGVTVSSVVPALKRAGLWKQHERKPQAPKVPREPKPKLPKVPKIRTSKVDVQVAARMIAEGKTYREIGLAFGVTSTAVLYALRRAGLWKARERNKVDVLVSANMVAEGKTYKEIGLVFGVRGRAVRSALQKAGLWFPFASRPKGRKPLKRHPKIDFAVAARMRHEGKSTAEIGKLFGVPLPTVRYFLKTRGLWKRAKVDVLRAAQMRSAGRTYQEIANTFGVSQQGLVCALQRAGHWKPSFRYYKVDLLKLALLFNANKSQHEMAASLGVPRWIVRQRLGQLGLWKRSNARSKPEPSFDANVAVEMYLAGKSVPQIARAFGYEERTGNNRTRTALIKAGVYQRKIKKAQAFAGPDSLPERSYLAS